MRRSGRGPRQEGCVLGVVGDVDEPMISSDRAQNMTRSSEPALQLLMLVDEADLAIEIGVGVLLLARIEKILAAVPNPSKLHTKIIREFQERTQASLRVSS
jgi:hypothetical protein